MPIKWYQKEDKTWSGIDDDNNVYTQPANRQTTIVTRPDGRTGMGWTPEQALQNATIAHQLTQALGLLQETLEKVANDDLVLDLGQRIQDLLTAAGIGGQPPSEDKVFYVDIPAGLDEDGTRQWTNLTQFDDKAKAVAWIRKNIGHCDDDGNVCLITEGWKE